MIGNELVNQIEILKKNLKKVKYPKQYSIKDFATENPEIFLLFLHYIIIEFDPEFYKKLLDKDYELFSKNDYRFIESVYKLLVKEFQYKPSINLNQFFTPQYLEHKVALTNDIIDIVLKNSTKKPSQNPQKQQKIQPKQLQQQNEEEIEEQLILQNKPMNLQNQQKIPQQQQNPGSFSKPKAQQMQNQEMNLNNQGNQDLKKENGILNGISQTLDQMNNFDQFFSDSMDSVQQKQQNLQNNMQQVQQNINQVNSKQQQQDQLQQPQQLYQQQQYLQQQRQQNIQMQNQVQQQQEQMSQQMGNLNISNQNQRIQGQRENVNKQAAQQQQFQAQQQQYHHQQKAIIQNQQFQQQTQEQEQNVQQIPERDVPQQPSQQQQNKNNVNNSQQQNVSKQELNSLLKLIVDINQNVNIMMKKFESFKGEVGDWMVNTDAQVQLMSNQIEAIQGKMEEEQQQQQLQLQQQQNQ